MQADEVRRAAAGLGQARDGQRGGVEANTASADHRLGQLLAQSALMARSSNTASVVAALQVS